MKIISQDGVGAIVQLNHDEFVKANRMFNNSETVGSVDFEKFVEKNYVFVYGTLKRGFGNHWLLENSEFKGECILHGNFEMYKSGMIPYVIQTEGDGDAEIHGELYLVNGYTKNQLDALEGVPHHYVDRKVAVNVDGESTMASIYIAAPSISRSLRNGEEGSIIRDGNYQRETYYI